MPLPPEGRGADARRIAEKVAAYPNGFWSDTVVLARAYLALELERGYVGGALATVEAELASLRALGTELADAALAFGENRLGSWLPLSDAISAWRAEVNQRTRPKEGA